MRRFFVLLCIGFLLFPTTMWGKTSNDPFSFQDAYELIGAYRAWDTTTGSSDVIVAVVDNGFDMFHPDLIDNVWKNVNEISDNGVDDDKNGYIDDVWGWNFEVDNNDPRPIVDDLSEQEKKRGVFNHGTIVAGIIGARGNNDIDGAGINWNVRLMNLKVLGNLGVGTMTPLGRAIRYAVDNGADIINVSMVSGESIPAVQEAMQYAQEKGVIIVAAAGNNMTFLNDSYLYPICDDAGRPTETVVGVSAITNDRRLAAFSNRGSACVDITAPGQDIASTIRFSPTNGLDKRYGTGYDGTSFAAPMVSGAAALIKSIQPTWGAKEIMAAIYGNVHHTPGQDEAVYANLFGNGLLQIDKAVLYAVSQLPQKTSQPVLEQPQAVPTTTTSSQAVILAAPKPETMLWLIDRGVGTVYSISSAGMQEQGVRSELKQVYDISSFTHKGTAYIATIKKDKKRSIVTIYNEEWKKITSWKVPFSLAVSLSAADIVGDEGIEFIVAPRTASKTVFAAYSFEGKELLTKNVPAKHVGVSVGLIPRKNDHSAIAALYKTKNGYVTSVVDGMGRELSSFSVPWLRSLGSIASADTNANEHAEIFISSGKGQEPSVTHYSLDGEFIRQLSVFDPAYRGGVDTFLTDYTADGMADLFFISLTGAGGVRRYSSTGQVAEEWPYIGKKGSGDLKLLIQPFPLTK